MSAVGIGMYKYHTLFNVNLIFLNSSESKFIHKTSPFFLEHDSAYQKKCTERINSNVCCTWFLGCK